MTDFELVKKALEAREMAYAPYSHHTVGAALLCDDGTVYKGCNIENAGYTPTNCAERTAFFKAVSEGYRKFKKIVIVGGMEGGSLDFTAPCGVCRQVMREFCSDDFEIVLAITTEQYKTYTLKEMLPCGFGPDNLK